MIYAKDCPIPKNTPPQNPVQIPFTVTKGLVYKVEVQFPRGCAGLAHVVIWQGGHQMWPYDMDHDFYGDNWVIAFDDTYLISYEPYVFDIYGYNLDDTYNHTITVRLGIVSQEVFMARFMPTLAYKYFLEVIEQLEKERYAREAEVVAHPFSWIPKETPEEVE